MSVFFNFLNRTSEVLLSLDSDGREKLATLDGKVLCIEITGEKSTPLLTLYMSPSREGVKINPHCEYEPNVTLSGSVMAFAKLGGAGVETLSDGQVTMKGDAESGQAFQKIFSQLDIDWEELLSRYVGDTPARKMGNVVRNFGDWALRSLDLSRINAGEFLQEEKRVLVTNLAMQRFQDSVDGLRVDTDRLQQRIFRLKKNESLDFSTDSDHPERSRG